jgi:hypothetical protein
MCPPSWLSQNSFELSLLPRLQTTDQTIGGSLLWEQPLGATLKYELELMILTYNPRIRVPTQHWLQRPDFGKGLNEGPLL